MGGVSEGDSIHPNMAIRRATEGYTRPVKVSSNHIHYSIDFSMSATSHCQPIGRIGQGAISGE